MIIDTHVHLDDDRYQNDLDEVIKRAKEGGVKKFIIPGADLDTLPKAVEISKRYEDVFFAVGIHPYDIDKYNEALLQKYISDEKCVAVGECGLDYYRLQGTQEEKESIKQKQKEVFKAQINLAKKYKKPLIVHIRDASLDSKEILLQEDAKEVGGVLHCFNADEQLLSLANSGFYFGIGGVVTFKNAKKLVNVLPKIPLDKLIIETDAP
jgi:TatD DNase family protein